MQGELVLQARLDGLWASVLEAVDDSDWHGAEGLLRRFLQLAPACPVAVWDTLAYVLLMQGDYTASVEALLPWCDDPARSFWLEHKLGDAYRGLNQLTEAELWYRRSLAAGSDSPLTCRNLLQVLDGLDPARAVAELQAWGQGERTPPGAWEGARDAAVLVPGLGLVDVLWQLGQADAPCRQRLLEEACYGFDLQRVRALLQSAARNSAGLSSWERALLVRLQGLGLLAATTDPGVGARRH